MEKSKHKYIFYFYPKENEKKGKFRVTGHSKEAKEYAKKYNRKYDFTKVY